MNNREKGGIFHRLSLSITSTLSFSYESLSALIHDLKKKEKYKEKKNKIYTTLKEKKP